MSHALQLNESALFEFEQVTPGLEPVPVEEFAPGILWLVGFAPSAKALVFAGAFQQIFMTDGGQHLYEGFQDGQFFRSLGERVG